MMFVRPVIRETAFVGQKGWSPKTGSTVHTTHCKHLKNRIKDVRKGAITLSIKYTNKDNIG